MSNPSPPPTATKRAASPLSPTTTQSAAKRAREDNGTTSSKEQVGSTNGKGEGKGGEAKMEDVNMEGADAGPSTSASATSSIPSAPVQAAESPVQQIQMRCLIVTQDASIIIGKGGSHVNEIREKSSARVTVSESIPGNPERILNVSGALDAVSKAFGLIVRRINDEPYDVASVPGSRAVTIKFIIPNSRMGSVIGKGGSKIKEIQEASGARLNASEAMLPGSTEVRFWLTTLPLADLLFQRVLSVSGVADAVHIAVYYIGTILLEYQERNPGTGTGSYRQQGAPSSRSGGSSYSSAGGAGAGAPMSAAPGMQTQQIFIPNALVGSIIGKAGSKINEIRSQSQCQIRVTEPGTAATPGAPVNPDERLVTITGLPANINTAVHMLYSRLEQEKAKLSDGGQ
ncbi:heterogeneous nuclear rnp K-like protein, partial [Tremellales sp. Uapishka_1]